MNASFQILFSLEILHDYYANQQCKDFDLQPSSDTFYLMKNLKMMTKILNNKLLVLTESENSKPVYAANPESIFRFYMLPKKANFSNYTNLSLAAQTDSVYYFSNLSGTVTSGKKFLSNKIATYSNSKNYVPGDLVVNGSGVLFEALQNSGPGSSVKATTNTDFWLNAGNKTYVSNADCIKKIPATYNFNLSVPSAVINISISGYQISSGEYDKELIAEIKNFNDPQKSVQLNFSPLPAGKYKIIVNGSEEFVYYDPQIINQAVFGVIEIHNHQNVSADFSILDNSGKIKELNYTLHFRNRSTIWKYITKTNSVTTVKDTAGAFEFSTLVTQQFTSTKPIPLTEAPYKTIAVQTPALGTINSIKNPSVNSIKQHIQSGSNYYCSEIFINY